MAETLNAYLRIGRLYRLLGNLDLYETYIKKYTSSVRDQNSMTILAEMLLVTGKGLKSFPELVIEK